MHDAWDAARVPLEGACMQWRPRERVITHGKWTVHFHDEIDYSGPEEQEELKTDARLQLSSGVLRIHRSGGSFKLSVPSSPAGRSSCGGWGTCYSTLKFTQLERGRPVRNIALASYILTDATMARARELSGVGNCGGNKEVCSSRNIRQEVIEPTSVWRRCPHFILCLTVCFMWRRSIVSCKSNVDYSKK